MAENETSAVSALDELIDLPRLETFAKGTIVPLGGTIGTLAEALKSLANADVAGEAGVNGLRYYNNLLQYATYTFSVATPTGDENPAEEGWYEISEGKYVLTSDTAIEIGKTYYQRSTTWNTIQTGGGDTSELSETVDNIVKVLFSGGGTVTAKIATDDGDTIVNEDGYAIALSKTVSI